MRAYRPLMCKVQPHRASLDYPFRNMAAQLEATPTRGGICYAHRDGGSSQGSTRHSLPQARRRGGFNSNDQLNSSIER